MLNLVRVWVINICTTVFFITAVQMILPDNKIKKYAKFVLGLILITVILNPIFKCFNKDFNVDAYTSKASKYIDDMKLSSHKAADYKDKNLNSTLRGFALNLKKLSEDKLKEKYPKSSYNVDVKVVYDDKKDKILIKAISVGVKDSSETIGGDIEKVQKVDIKNSTSKTENKIILKDEKSNEVRQYLSKELGVSSDTITLYKL